MRQFASRLLPPRINELERGHWHWRKLTQKYAEDLAIETMGAALEPVEGPVMLEVVVANRADWDARLKALCDGLQAIGIFADDAQVVEARVIRAMKGVMDYAVLIRWRPAEALTTEAIEAIWGGPVKAPKVRRAKKQSKGGSA